MSKFNPFPGMFTPTSSMGVPPVVTGMDPAPADLRSAPPPDQSERGMLRSGLLDIFPQEIPRSAYFSEISVPVGIAIPNTAHAGWYVFQRFSIPRDVPEGVYIGADVQLSPADVDAARTPSAGTAAAWGDLAGTTAWIVLDVNTGLELNTWTGRDAYLPGIGTAPQHLVSPQTARPYLAKWIVPPGKISSTTPSKLYLGQRFLPAVYRLIKSADVLDVCLVIPRAQALAAANKVICGHVDITLWFLPDSGPRAFSQT